MKRLMLIAALAAANCAVASGDYGPSYTRYKAYTKPDTDAEAFQAGTLGVLQPGMGRVYLYTAWRAIMLGPKVRQNAGMEWGLERAAGGAFGDGWPTDAEVPYSEAWKRETGLVKTNFGACSNSSGALAMATLKTIKARKDVSPARIKAWVSTQEQVWSSCKIAEDARYENPSVLLKVQIPPSLADSEPAFWRQLRSYQQASMMFYTERYADATTLFEQIGATPAHPMQKLGAYLALRSQSRLASRQADTMTDAQRAGAYAALERRGAGIVADDKLEENHEAASAALRAARITLVPQAAYADLSSYLSDPARDPFADDSLGDWAIASARIDATPALAAQSRRKHDFVSWIENLRDCGYAKGADTMCRKQAQVALAQWQRSQSRAWLVAALMLAERFKPGMEAQARAVKQDDPEYITVRYHLARLLRLDGRAAQARAISDAALKLELTHSARNLFREERFAVATSLADAARFMKRVDIDRSGFDGLAESFNEDVVNWLQFGLGSADMAAVARESSLPSDARARLAGAAFVRAELLGKTAVAMKALDVLAPLAPQMKERIDAYRRASGPAERRHQMLLAALYFGLSAQITEDSGPIELSEDEHVAASNWCSFKRDPSTLNTARSFPWQLPAMPVLGNSALAKAELAALAPLKTATGFVGQHVLARAKSHPRDPDLPWLLHVVVASTRGGCLDADSRKLSRDAFTLLHKRFPDHPWTRETRYFY